MPKVVDPELRRTDIAEAVFRLVAREGVHAASLRRVATEAGLNVGSVRHYFANHEDLLIFAAETMYARVTERVGEHVAAMDAGADKRASVMKMLSEFLPLDDRRRDETTICFAFLAESRLNPELRVLAQKLHRGLRVLVGHILRGARVHDIETNTELVSAMLDGLAFNAVHIAGAPDGERATDVVGKMLDHLVADR
ncbi:TetR/AcrR family transcriptional regulator [Amycolatopsis sp. CA-230715]|uniref:TetR/AcrR family transcriptional regulator n=1 Tax=Amycolatopsis sp. CA-230715 TaxID=2745196 RepID=UPI001C017A6E|nr:TetR/AcrR family transcriptional regulator [Amycolatopsis sp. CA-230715]QWF83613.1 HTH-type transcriptional regulator BetI [Amycolatopsis sp. CA-230715]